MSRAPWQNFFPPGSMRDPGSSGGATAAAAAAGAPARRVAVGDMNAVTRGAVTDLDAIRRDHPRINEEMREYSLAWVTLPRMKLTKEEAQRRLAKPPPKPSYAEAARSSPAAEEAALKEKNDTLRVHLAQIAFSENQPVQAMGYLELVSTKTPEVYHNIGYLLDLVDDTASAMQAYAQAGLQKSMFRMAFILLSTADPDRETGMMTPQSALASSNALSFFEILAGKGDAKAAFILGTQRARGHVVAQDDTDVSETAVKHLRQAADGGVVYAYRELALFHLATAMSIQTEAIDPKAPDAASLVEEREGRAHKEYMKMVAELQTGVDRHDDAACAESLARAYVRGQGVKKDTEKAFLLFGKAWKQGSPSAGHEVAKMTKIGMGVRMPNAVKFVQILKELSTDPYNYPPAMSDLAMLYRSGFRRQVKQDTGEFKKLLDRCIDARYTDAFAFALTEKIYTKDKDTDKYNKLVESLRTIAAEPRHRDYQTAVKALVVIGEMSPRTVSEENNTSGGDSDE